MFGASSFSQTSFSDNAVVDVAVSVTGVEGTGGVGDATARNVVRGTVEGVEARVFTGGSSVTASAVVSPTGVSSGAGAVGDVTITTGTGVTVSPTGLEAFMPVGGSAFSVDGDAQLSTAQKKFGTASLLLDGTDDFVESDESIDLSSTDFTVDMWVYADNVSGYKGLWQTGTSSLLRAYLIGDKVRLSVGPSTIIFTSTTGITASTWTMISIERDGNDHRLYINGTLEETGSTGNRPDTGTFSIGKNSFGDFDGYIDEVRLSSVARYEGTSFTEPTSEFTVDKDTTALLHFNGTNGSTDIVNDTGVSVTVSGDALVSPTGVEAAGEIGDVSVSGGANVTATGLEATASVGSVIATGGAIVSVTGVSATGQVGDVTVTGDANVFPTGVSGTGEVTSPIVWGRIIPDPGTTWSEIDPSSPTTWTDIAA